MLTHEKRLVLLNKYEQLSQKLAQKQIMKSTSNMYADDIKNIARISLWNLIDEKLEKRPNPEGYLTLRIKWNILDYLRGMDCLSRKSRRKFKKENMESGSYYDTLLHVNIDDAELYHKEFIVFCNPLEKIEHEEELSFLKKCKEILTEKERKIVEAYYSEDKMKMLEIAKIFNVTQGRVSQIIKKALNKMRKRAMTIETQEKMRLRCL